MFNLPFLFFIIYTFKSTGFPLGIALCCAMLSRLAVSDSLWPRGLLAHQAPLSMGFSRQEYWSGLPCPPPGDLPNPGIKPRYPALQETDSFPSEPPGKPKNTGVGSLSLLQGIFPTQESNLGLLHCRRILYQLSYQGSPSISCTPKHVGMSWHNHHSVQNST